MIFDVIDASKRKIRLTREQWGHISTDHPEISPLLEEIRMALQRPTKLVPSDYDQSVYHYYRYQKRALAYLLVIVKYLTEMALSSQHT